MAAWDLLPSELLRRVALKSQQIEPLELRLVCRCWARNVASWVHTIRLASPGAFSDWLQVTPADVLEDIVAFRGLTTLDLPDLKGTHQVLQQLATLTQLRELQLARLHQRWPPGGLLLALTGLQKLGLTAVPYIDYAPTLQGVLNNLPQLRQLSMCCSGVNGQSSHEVGLLSPTGSGACQSLAVTGSIGLSEADVRSIAGLQLSSLHAQLISAAAFAALTALTSLHSLRISDWQPGPSGGGEPLLLNLEQFSQLQGLTLLDLEHTFGNFQIVELDGLAGLSRLAELRLHIPSSLEDTEELHALAQLPARVGLSMPFDAAFDFDHLCSVTSLHFQELMPVINDGEVDQAVRQEICMGLFSGLEGLRELHISCSAAEIVGEGLMWLGGFQHLSSLKLEDTAAVPNGWAADHPDSWAHAISRLSALKELAIRGCNNLLNLQLADLRSLTSLALTGNPSLNVEGLSSLSLLRRLDASGCSRLAVQCLVHCDCLPHLRDLSLEGCRVSDDDMPRLLPLARLRSLDLRMTAVTVAGLRSLRRLPYLRQLRHTAEAAS